MSGLTSCASEWDTDRPLTAMHRAVLFGYLARYASNRLLIHDTLRRHPQILQQQIDRPVIVTGLPRSGTTHLVNLLAADARFHSLPLWQSYEPVPLPGESALPDGTDPRYARCAAAWEGMRTVTPLLAAMHPMEPDHIHEELELMGPDFASYNFEWLSMSPRWRDHYLGTDQTPHYEYLKRVLQLLQWQRRQAGKRWVLKCPQHLEQLPVLLKVFPDATVVFTHRDPVAVIQSTITMQAYTQRIQRPRVEMLWLRDYWVARIERLLRACVRDCELVPAGAQRPLPVPHLHARSLEDPRRGVCQGAAAADPTGACCARAVSCRAPARQGRAGTVRPQARLCARPAAAARAVSLLSRALRGARRERVAARALAAAELGDASENGAHQARLPIDPGLGERRAQVGAGRVERDAEIARRFLEAAPVGEAQGQLRFLVR